MRAKTYQYYPRYSAQYSHSTCRNTAQISLEKKVHSSNKRYPGQRKVSWRNRRRTQRTGDMNIYISFLSADTRGSEQSAGKGTQADTSVIFSSEHKPYRYLSKQDS